MSFSLLARKLVCGLAVVVPVLVSAQSGFAPLGGEYAIAGALANNQGRPRMSINAGGGYLVWQDKSTFGNRMTVMGRPLDSGLTSTLPPFRINSNAAGGHENPHVALLKNGGAVFVWQGGQFGFQHIYARFLSPSNTWVGLDQLVNSSTRVYQDNLDVAVLTDGNVIVTYTTFNTNSMRDVYGQLYSPVGAKLGGEFQINEYTAFNQRSASVAALTNGGFIVAYVSEHVTDVSESVSATPTPVSSIARPDVSIFARIFNANGTPANSEFQVNSGSDIAAEPVVAVSSEGGVLFSWSSFNAQLPNNGWDVMARAFTFTGNIPLGGSPTRANTQLYGDQHTPQVSAVGSTYLTVWTSLGQDGSREGIYGRFLNADGSVASDEFRVNSTTRGVQQQPSVSADNSGRFLTAWTGPTFGPSRNDLFAQVYASSSFVGSSVANNYGSPNFVGQTITTVGTNIVGIHDPSIEPVVLDYPGVIVGGGSGIPATNAFAGAAGKYDGLFYDLNGVSTASAGSFTATLNGQRNYSAKLTFAGGSYSFSGKLDDFGNTGSRIINRGGGLSPLVVSWQANLFGADQISGTIKAGNEWNAVIYANRQTFNNKTAPAPYAGAYTLTIPGFAKGPGGTSFGTVQNSTAGIITFNGLLADGKKISQTSALSKGGIWPFFAAVPGGGLVMSWIDFAAAPQGGNVAWVKPANKLNPIYPAGFTNEATATLSLNLGATAGARSVNLSGAGLEPAISKLVTLGENGKGSSTNGVSVAVALGTGAFTGKVPNPIAGKPAIPINGVMVTGAVGEGFFLGNGVSGKVTVQQP